MPIDTPKGEVRLFDDFLGDTLNGDLYVETVTSSGTVAITDVEVDGTVQLDTDNTSGDAAQFAGNLNWRVQDGSLRMEVRVKPSVITTLRQFIGFNNATSETDTVPITCSGTTWTTNAETAIGFVFDTDMTTDIWTAMWVDDDSDSATAIATLQYTGLAPIADTYFTYIVELQDQGSGNQVRAELSIIDNNGRIYSKTFESTIDRDVLLCPYVGHENASAAVHETTIDYLEVTKSRATSID